MQRTPVRRRQVSARSCTGACGGWLSWPQCLRAGLPFSMSRLSFCRAVRTWGSHGRQLRLFRNTLPTALAASPRAPSLLAATVRQVLAVCSAASPRHTSGAHRPGPSASWQLPSTLLATFPLVRKYYLPLHWPSSATPRTAARQKEHRGPRTWRGAPHVPLHFQVSYWAQLPVSRKL